jgi:endonuclease/exonuclease/phosphatase family metal-dependent hydrolase
MPTPLRAAWTALAVLAFLLPSVAAAGAAGAVSTPARQVRVLQLNLCGSGYAVCFTGRATAQAARVVRATAPDVVTLNEVCADSLPVLARAVRDAHRGGTVEPVFEPVTDRRTGAAVRCVDGSRYGVALVAWHDRPAASHVTAGRYPVQDRGQDEQRAWLCLRSARLAACTTHLASGDPATTLAQCRYLVGTVLPAQRSGDVPLVAAGDLNLSAGPASRPLSACLGTGPFGHADDGVQHVLSAGLAASGSRAVGMAGTTDHPGLLVTLDRPAP